MHWGHVVAEHQDVTTALKYQESGAIGSDSPRLQVWCNLAQANHPSHPSSILAIQFQLTRRDIHQLSLQRSPPRHFPNLRMRYRAYHFHSPFLQPKLAATTFNELAGNGHFVPVEAVTFWDSHEVGNDRARMLQDCMKGPSTGGDPRDF